MPVGPHHRTHGHPNVWAFLTVVTFPIVLICTEALGAPGMWPFIFALVATSLILFLEAIVRGKLWMFEPHFAAHIGHPDTPLRIVVFMASILFVLETAFFLLITINKDYDGQLLAFIARRECVTRGDTRTNPLCSVLQTLTKSTAAEPTAVAGNTVSFAIRSRAAQLWFPNDQLVTCAMRSIGSGTESDASLRAAAIVRCVSWSIDKGILKTRSTHMRYVGAILQQSADDGFYRVIGWTEDYNSPNWDSTLGSIAEQTRRTAQSLAILPALTTALDAENLGLAQATIGK